MARYLIFGIFYSIRLNEMNSFHNFKYFRINKLYHSENAITVAFFNLFLKFEIS